MENEQELTIKNGGEDNRLSSNNPPHPSTSTYALAEQNLQSEEKSSMTTETSASSPVFSVSSNTPLTPSLTPTPPHLHHEQFKRELTLSWNELSVYVQLKKRRFFKPQQKFQPLKRIINNVSGIVRPGTLLGIMGASGAGKTTLLNVLAHKLSPEVCLDGDVLVNGARAGRDMGKISGFVYQDDIFIEVLTVAEHLNFMVTLLPNLSSVFTIPDPIEYKEFYFAQMKLDRRLKSWERERTVNDLVVELGLTNSMHTRIKNLSGGEKKRLAFGSEVLTDPIILFCDEPTTGLDSYSAQRLVALMEKMALSAGKTILCTIHQPSSQIFSMFDQLLLLAEGRTAYFGPRSEAPSFFAEQGFICPELFNPADFFIRTLAVGKQTSSSNRSDSLRTVKKICDAYSTSKMASDIQEQINSSIITANVGKDSVRSGGSVGGFDFRTESISSGATSRNIPLATGIYTSGKILPGWFRKTSCLTRRTFLESVRNPDVHLFRILQKIFLVILLGSTFFGIGLSGTHEGIQNVEGLIFLLITESTYPVMYGVVHVFPTALPLFIREYKAHLYGVDSYYLSTLISLLPGFTIDPVIFITFTYWLVGLRSSIISFTYATIILILNSYVAAACGFFCSSSTDSITTSMAILIPVDYILFVASGILINLDSLPVYLSWVKYISWFMYSTEGISITQWNGLTNLSCNTTLTTIGSNCLRDGESVLSSYTFASSHFPMDIIGLILLFLFFHLAAFISLFIRIRRK